MSKIGVCVGGTIIHTGSSPRIQSARATPRQNHSILAPIRTSPAQSCRRCTCGRNFNQSGTGNSGPMEESGNHTGLRPCRWHVLEANPVWAKSRQPRRPSGGYSTGLKVLIYSSVTGWCAFSAALIVTSRFLKIRRTCANTSVASETRDGSRDAGDSLIPRWAFTRNNSVSRRLATS